MTSLLNYCLGKNGRMKSNFILQMKKIFTLVAMMAFAIFVSAQTKKVSILGDSYSTFQGMNPEGYAPFYPNDKNDVTKVEQTWWSLYIKAMGYELEKNNSWGGTTICNTGYGGMDATANSFNARYELLGDPDIIFVFGGTNDAWARSPIGEYKYADWTKDDCKAFRPALACLLVNIQKKYPKAKVYAILNSELREEINESSREVCKHYNVPLIELHDIEKQNGQRYEEHLRATYQGYRQIRRVIITLLICWRYLLWRLFYAIVKISTNYKNYRKKFGDFRKIV